MAKSTTQIQKESDKKRGVAVKALKLPIDIIDLLEQLSIDTGKPQNAIVSEALKLYAQQRHV